MPFHDLLEGQTHHEKDSCYKCAVCEQHFFTNDSLHMHICLTDKEKEQKQYQNQKLKD